MRQYALIVMAAAALACGQAKSGDTAASGAKQASRQVVTKKRPADQAPAAKKAAPVLDTLVMAGRLIEIPGTMPPNDLYNYVYVMKYRVIQVEKGAYEGREILVGVYNPLIPRKRIAGGMRANAAGDVAKFVAGDKHLLRLVTPIEKVWKEQVEDDYFDSDLPRYYAVRVDRAR